MPWWSRKKATRQPSDRTVAVELQEMTRRLADTNVELRFVLTDLRREMEQGRSSSGSPD